MELHPVAHLRMNVGAGQSRPVAQIKRVLRQVVRELGCAVTRGGMNVWVQRDRVEAAIVIGSARSSLAATC